MKLIINSNAGKAINLASVESFYIGDRYFEVLTNGASACGRDAILLYYGVDEVRKAIFDAIVEFSTNDESIFDVFEFVTKYKKEHGIL